MVASWNVYGHTAGGERRFLFTYRGTSVGAISMARREARLFHCVFDAYEALRVTR